MLLRKMLGKKPKNESSEQKAAKPSIAKPKPKTTTSVVTKPAPSSTNKMVTKKLNESDPYTRLVKASEKQLKEKEAKLEAIEAEVKESEIEMNNLKAQNEELFNSLIKENTLEALFRRLLSLVQELSEIQEIDICFAEIANLSLKQSDPSEYIKKCEPVIKQYKATSAPDTTETFEIIFKAYMMKYKASTDILPAIRESHMSLVSAAKSIIDTGELIEKAYDWIKRTLCKEQLEEIYRKISSIEGKDNIEKIKKEILSLDLSVTNFQFLLSELAGTIDRDKRNIKACIGEISSFQLKNLDSSIERCESTLNRCGETSLTNDIAIFELMFETYAFKYPKILMKDNILKTHEELAKTAGLLASFKRAKLAFENGQGIKDDNPKEKVTFKI